MKKVKRKGEEILLFDDAEELKWFFHKKLCKGDSSAEFYMNRIMEEDLRTNPRKLNEWLTDRVPYRVKEK